MTNYYSKIEEAATRRERAEIERLRADGLRFAQWIDELYSGLPRDRPPGPPITLLQEMRAAFGGPVQSPPKKPRRDRSDPEGGIPGRQL